MKKQIKFIKWIDPFAEPEDSGNSQYMDSYEETERQQQRPSHRSGPTLVGPMGVIPLNEHNQPSKVFNFWMMHTNFNITQRIKNAVKTTVGVETIDVYTRYRCRLSFGRVFDEYSVMNKIKKKLCSVRSSRIISDSNSNASTLDKIGNHLRNKYEYWAIFELPDGQIDYVYGNTAEDVRLKVNQHTVLRSWETNGNNKT